jgi:hypothetical protein
MEAFETLGAAQAPGQVRLNTFDGRPVYRFRSGRDERIVYADTGEAQTEVSPEMIRRAVTAWTGQPADRARVDTVDEVDQWTLQVGLRNVRPLWKYSWPNGEQVYISGASGEVVQYTTTASRWGAYLGAIPHWLYFTPLRKHGPQWSRVVIWSSGIGTGAAMLGIVIGVWMYSPAKRYRYAGARTSIPYRGQKRWHTILGLIFGLGAATWAFSGMLSMDPFPSLAGGGPNGRGGDGAEGVVRALRSRAPLTAFAAKDPRAALAQASGLAVKELEFSAFAGEPVYIATLAAGDTRVLPVNGEPRAELDRQQIMNLVTAAAQGRLAELRVIEQYDRYYLDRRRQRPLPVILARLDDEAQTRFYIDPKTGRIAGGYSADNWVERWLYHGLHSLDFPWLYNYRPLWDIIVIAFMVGGTALCVTSLVLAWRVIGRKLRAFGGPGEQDPPIEAFLPSP